MYLKKLLSQLSVFSVILFISMGIFYQTSGAEEFTCKKTASSIFIWGKAMIGEQPLNKGDIIVATVPSVVVNNGGVGEFTTTDKSGSYGAMVIYGDDPTTPEKDGAITGDEVSLKVIGADGKTTYAVPGTVIWKSAGDVQEFNIEIGVKK